MGQPLLDVLSMSLEVINFRNNSLEGEIPANPSHSSNLTNIVLAGNRLTCKIPAELGSLLKLEALTIHGNNLAGEMPHSFGNLSSLLRLSAAYNMLEGSIPNVDRLTKLTTLGLGGNKLSVSVDFKGLPHLWWLSMGSDEA
uniref:Uncharacterized protein n=1 Tax=Nelumbo nucifera TaxID=4432 RepID=A0A822XPZ6_NELNU|nr:TPA_asm: hypothetical protein HUJ06_023575 [Nelumbo nucifera]